VFKILLILSSLFGCQSLLASLSGQWKVDNVECYQKRSNKRLINEVATKFSQELKNKQSNTFFKISFKDKEIKFMMNNSFSDAQKDCLTELSGDYKVIENKLLVVDFKAAKCTQENHCVKACNTFKINKLKGLNRIYRYYVNNKILKLNREIKSNHYCGAGSIESLSLKPVSK